MVSLEAATSQAIIATSHPPKMAFKNTVPKPYCALWETSSKRIRRAAGSRMCPLDDHGRKQRGAEEVGDKNHNPNLSMFGTVLGSVNATVTGITVFSV